MAKNPATKQNKATKNEIIADLKRVNQLMPNSGFTKLTRDFFRSNSKYTDGAFKVHFPGFNDAVLKDAGILPVPIELMEDDISIADKLDLERQKLADKKQGKNKLLTEALSRINTLEDERNVLFGLKDQTPEIFDIQPKTNSGQSESVAVILASDWHIEERVLPGDVGGLNRFNLELAGARAERFWQGSQRLWDIMRKDTAIKTIALFLGGDFISNTLHEDQAESNLLLPADAIYRAQSLILSGIRFLLEHTDADLHIVCHSGNHGRMTKKQRHTTEIGNSLEQFMYNNIKDFLEGEERITFQIAEGYHSIVRLFNGAYSIRFHHGHGMKYGGGVGGMYIPVNKAINQWNKGTKVNLDCFGHFHQSINGGNFVCNGSLIGYNAYAVAIKADFEKPTQTFFLVNKRHLAKTMYTPIFLE